MRNRSKFLRSLARTAFVVVSLQLLVRPAALAAGDQDVTLRLIQLLVKRGVLKQDEADALLAEAQAEKPAEKPKPAARARSAEMAAAPAPGAASAPTPADMTTPVPAPEPSPSEEPVPPGTVRVTYVPQIVRDQIAQQVKDQLVRSGDLPPNGKTPDYLSRFHFFGDIRLRSESDLFPGNSNAPQLFDFASINSGSPYDLTGSSGRPPLLDTTEDRWRPRLRARAGVDVDIDDGLTAEIRIATGNDASPVTTNQTLGQNGISTKYAIWLDRAYIRDVPVDALTLLAGRMPNPFWTTDLMYYEDLGFDGVALQAAPKLGQYTTGYFTTGAFPVFSSAFNFGTTSFNSAYASHNAWLFAVQAGAETKLTESISGRLEAGYFSYSNVAGKISSPCIISFSSDVCDSDASRLLFPGNGNTMIPLRQIVSAPNNTDPQYFGLASGFRVIDLHGRVDFHNFEPILLFAEAEGAVNIAFNKSRVDALGVNNFVGSSGNATVQAGNKAWMVKLGAGTPKIEQRWDWQVSLAYKHLDSDSVLAALTDSDFHLGGTNAKGFILSGSLGVARNTWLTAKWLSATQVSGPPYAVDVVQADLNVRF